MEAGRGYREEDDETEDNRVQYVVYIFNKTDRLFTL